jgi:hypothetical protein
MNLGGTRISKRAMNQLNFSESIILGTTLFVFVALLTIPVAATVLSRLL